MSRMLKWVFASALLTAGGWAVADDCLDKAQTQVQMNACAAADLAAADKPLNRAYQEMLARLKGNDPALRQLREAQRQWLGFRDAECRFSTRSSAGGSINPMLVAQCRAELTRARVTQLQAHLRCGQGADAEGALCAVPPKR